MAKHEISLSPTAIFQINEALTNGHDVQIGVRRDNLIIWEIHTKKRYEVVVAKPQGSAR